MQFGRWKSIKNWLMTLAQSTKYYQSLTQADRFTRHCHLSPFSSCLCCHAALRSRYFICSSPNWGVETGRSALFCHGDACCIFSPLALWPLSHWEGAAEPSETGHTTQKRTLIPSLSLLPVIPRKGALCDKVFSKQLLFLILAATNKGCCNTLLITPTYGMRLFPTVGSTIHEINLLWHGFCSIIAIKTCQEVGERERIDWIVVIFLSWNFLILLQDTFYIEGWFSFHFNLWVSKHIDNTGNKCFFLGEWFFLLSLTHTSSHFFSQHLKGLTLLGEGKWESWHIWSFRTFPWNIFYLIFLHGSDLEANLNRNA